MKNLFALTVLRIINLNFRTRYGRNPDMVSLENYKENTIYVRDSGSSVNISVYKVSSRCLSLDITDETQIEAAVASIKEKIKCDDLIMDV